jgi:hypothetical protein
VGRVYIGTEVDESTLKTEKYGFRVSESSETEVEAAAVLRA